jgi:hypothetical protein
MPSTSPQHFDGWICQGKKAPAQVEPGAAPGTHEDAKCMATSGWARKMCPRCGKPRQGGDITTLQGKEVGFLDASGNVIIWR